MKAFEGVDMYRQISAANGHPDNGHGKNVLVNTEASVQKLAGSAGKKAPNLPNLVLNNLSGNPSIYPYPYSNVAGAIKSPNPRVSVLNL